MGKKALSILLLLSAAMTVYSQQLNQTHIPLPKPLYSGPDTTSITIIGDVMMHTKQLQHNHRSFLINIAPLLKNADFAIANMEFSLGGEPYTGYPLFSAPDYYPRYVAEECGVDVFLTSNNHILDRKAVGLKRTLDVYSSLRDSLGTKFTGASRDEEELYSTYPLFLFKNGIKIALVNFTYGTNIGPDSTWPRVNRMRKDEVEKAMSRAKEEGANFIVVLPHWGTEYELRHDKAQEEWAKWLVEQGADVIVGSHPHVVQDSTHIAGVPVLYSTGNAVSNMSQTNTRLGLVVTLRFINDMQNEKMRMLEPVLDFLWCSLPGNLNDSYTSIIIKEWATRRNEWLIPSDYDNMMSTLSRVKEANGVE